MFNQMFTGIDGDGPFGGGGGAGVWRSFLTEEYSKSFAKTGGIGIADRSLSRAARPAGSAGVANLKAETAMSTVPSFSTPMTQPAPIASAAEAEKLIAHFLEVMDKLIGVLRQETDLVRAGRLAQAAALAQPKADLTAALCRRRVAAAGEPQPSHPHHRPIGSRRCGAITTPSARCCRSI